MFFRLITIFFTVASLILAVWSIVGSYKNESYLTDNYLFGFQTTNLNLSAIIREAILKRDLEFHELKYEVKLTPTTTTQILQPRDVLSDLALVATAGASLLAEALGGQTLDVQSLISAVATNTAALASYAATATELDELRSLASAASIPESIVTLAASFDGDINSIVLDLVDSINSTDLGLAEYYLIGYWGYCRGNVGEKELWISSLGKFGKQFNNQHVTFTYCSPAKVGYKFDPLELLKHEIMNLIEGKIDGGTDGTRNALTETIEAELLALVSSVTYEDLKLPGDLSLLLTLLHNLTVASFALILAGACLAFISFVFQLIGICRSPDNSCLLCLNFMLMVLVFIVTLVGSALSTGTYIFVRKEVNNNVEQYGVKGWLSVQYYAFLWSAAVAALLLIVFAFLGYCCGCFHSGKKRYRSVRNEHYEPDMRYDHTYKGNESY